MQSPNLYLIGPRGAGKSAAGQRASEVLGVSFVDADRAVEELAGRSISQIFQEQGEATFRQLEKRVMVDLLHRHEMIVATGGGCILDPEIHRQLQQSQAALLLIASPAVLGQRIRGSDRPSLTGVDPTEEIAAVLEQRRSLYRSCAAETIDTGSLTLEDVVHGIQRFWQTLSDHNLR